MSIYLFYREDGWYPLELGSDLEAIENAKMNEGTKQVRRINVMGDESTIIWQKET